MGASAAGKVRGRFGQAQSVPVDQGSRAVVSSLEEGHRGLGGGAKPSSTQDTCTALNLPGLLQNNSN